MFGLSGEHLLILAGILLIFGPRKLPELGASVGRALRNFKEGFNAPVGSATPSPVQETKAILTQVRQVGTEAPVANTVASAQPAAATVVVEPTAREPQAPVADSHA